MTSQPGPPGEHIAVIRGAHYGQLDRASLETYLEQLVPALGMSPLGDPVFRWAGPGDCPWEGWTAVQVITSSHVAVHAYRLPGGGELVTVLIYSCQPFTLEPARVLTGQALGLSWCEAEPWPAAVPAPPDPGMTTETWYLAICQDCKPILPQPFSDKAERDRWAAIHEAATGHAVLPVTETREP